MFDLEMGAEFEPEGLDDRKVLAFDLEMGVEFEPEGMGELGYLCLNQRI